MSHIRDYLSQMRKVGDGGSSSGSSSSDPHSASALQHYSSQGSNSAPKVFELLHSNPHWQLTLFRSEEVRYRIWRVESAGDATCCAELPSSLPDAATEAASVRLTWTAPMSAGGGALGQVCIAVLGGGGGSGGGSERAGGRQSPAPSASPTSPPPSGRSGGGGGSGAVVWNLWLPNQRSWVLSTGSGSDAVSIDIVRVEVAYPDRSVSDTLHYHEMMSVAYRGWATCAKRLQNIWRHSHQQQQQAAASNNNSGGSGGGGAFCLRVTSSTDCTKLETAIRQHAYAALEMTQATLHGALPHVVAAFRGCASLQELIFTELLADSTTTAAAAVAVSGASPPNVKRSKAASAIDTLLTALDALTASNPTSPAAVTLTTSRLRILTLTARGMDSDSVRRVLQYFLQKETPQQCSVRELRFHGAGTQWDAQCDTQMLMLIGAGPLCAVSRSDGSSSGAVSEEAAASRRAAAQALAESFKRRAPRPPPAPGLMALRESGRLVLQLRFASQSVFVPYDAWSSICETAKLLTSIDAAAAEPDTGRRGADGPRNLNDLSIDAPHPTHMDPDTVKWLVQFVESCVGAPEAAELNDPTVTLPLHTVAHEVALRGIVGDLSSAATHARVAMLAEMATALRMHTVARMLLSHLLAYVRDTTRLRGLLARSRTERMALTFDALST